MMGSILALQLIAATLYRDPTVNVPGADYGIMPTNAPSIGDVLTLGPNGASWTTLTNFVHVWSGTSGGLLIPIASTNYFPPHNSATNLITVEAAGATRVPVTRAFVLQRLFVVWTPAPGSGKTNFLTVLTNGVASPLAVQIIGTATNANDVTDAVTLVAGDQVGVRLVTQSLATPGKASWSFESR